MLLKQSCKDRDAQRGFNPKILKNSLERCEYPLQFMPILSASPKARYMSTY